MRIAFDLRVAQGIGDAVCGLYAATGLVRAGHAVVLSTRHHPWLLGHQSGAGVGDYGATQVDASARYPEQLEVQRNASPSLNRAQWYIQNIANRRGAELGQIEPIVPEFRVPLEPPPIAGRYLVLNPFSAHTERIWSGDKWRALAIKLLEAGITPIAIGSARDARGLRAIFQGVRGSYFYWHQTPNWVRSTLRQSIGFVGNDSGMTHIAASLGTPTTVIMSHLRPSFVFGPAKITACVPEMAKWACRFCGWHKNAGFRFTSPCLPNCAALQSISVDTVLAAVLGNSHEKDHLCRS